MFATEFLEGFNPNERVYVIGDLVYYKHKYWFVFRRDFDESHKQTLGLFCTHIDVLENIPAGDVEFVGYYENFVGVLQKMFETALEPEIGEYVLDQDNEGRVGIVISANGYQSDSTFSQESQIVWNDGKISTRGFRSIRRTKQFPKDFGKRLIREESFDPDDEDDE